MERISVDDVLGLGFGPLALGGTQESLDDLRFFVRKVNELEQQVKDLKKDRHLFYILEKHLRCVYLFAEATLGIFMTEICKRDSTLLGCLSNPSRFSENIVLPEIDVLQEAMCISLYRGKYIGHQKEGHVRNATWNPREGFRLLPMVASFHIPEPDAATINELWEIYGVGVKDNVFERYRYLFYQIPYGKWGKKHQDREIIDAVFQRNAAVLSFNASEIVVIVERLIENFYLSLVDIS